MNKITWMVKGNKHVGVVGGIMIEVYTCPSSGQWKWMVSDRVNPIRFGVANSAERAITFAESVINHMTAPPPSTTLTKWQLSNLLYMDGTPTLYLPDGRIGIVDSVQRESGSGKSFNVKLNIGNGLYTSLHVKTSD